MRVDPALLGQGVRKPVSGGEGAPPAADAESSNAPSAGAPRVAPVTAPPVIPQTPIDATDRERKSDEAVTPTPSEKNGAKTPAKARNLDQGAALRAPDNVARRQAEPPAPAPATRVQADSGAGSASTPEVRDDVLPAPALRPSPALTPITRDRDQPLPTYVAADRISGRTEDEVVGEGNVELRRIGNTLKSDKLTYWQIEDEVEAVGNVHLTQDQDVISGPKLRLNLGDSVGYFENPTYSLTRISPSAPQTATPVTGYGHADRIDFEGENHYRLTNATYSTCMPDNPDWYIQGRDVRLDYDREEGEALGGKLVFMDVPILYTPWIDFPLNNQRKSGLLPPTFGGTNKTGTDVTIPYYWNIAPNRDATIAPRVMSRRGVLLDTEFRYLEPTYSGIARIDYLPKDLVLDKRRSAYSFVHQQNFGGGLYGSLNVNGVSDDTYFTDLGTRIATTSQTYLLRQGALSYSGGWWTANGNVQRYQTLQDPALPPVAIPYDRLPQVTVLAGRPDFYGGSAFAFNGEYVDFHHPTQVLGKRATLYPQLSLPLVTSAFYVTPKVGYHVTHYDLSRQDSATPQTITRTVPIMSVDSGMTFERDMTWEGKDYIQTLEPRLYYLKVANRNQSQIPIFDTSLADFNFAQIFSENIFVGGDRIADANQLTAAVTSRIVDPANGAELIRGAVGQRYYFRDQSVTLPGTVPRTDRRADFLAALSGQVLPKTWVDSGWQYNPRDKRTERFTVAARYQPEFAKVLNVGYRFDRDVLREIDVAGQWPLWGKWYGVGRYNFSLFDHRLIESIAGLEYDGGCWVGRMVAHRFATAAQTASTALFFQIEFNGFSRIGSNPLDILKRGIRGYGRINQPAADPVFGAE